MMYDQGILTSMMNSSRRIHALTVDGCTNRLLKDKTILDADVERLKDFLSRFGYYIKVTTLNVVVMSPAVVDLLNLMPNVEKISLDRCTPFLSEANIETAAIPSLRLHKLTEIESSFCDETTLDIFKELPPGVLSKVTMKSYNDPIKSSIKLLCNQNNIKEIETDDVEQFDFRPMQLTSLIVNGRQDLTSIFRYQVALKFLKVSTLAEADLRLICNELKSLEQLEFDADDITSNEFNDIIKLNKLKVLSLTLPFHDSDRINDSLSLIKSRSLKVLNLKCDGNVTVLTFGLMSLNNPGLEELNVRSESSLNVINKIIENFPNLKELKFNNDYYRDSDEYFFQYGLVNANLKNLEISTDLESYEDLANLVGCCSKLEIFSILSHVDENFLRLVLTKLPNLKTLLIFPRLLAQLSSSGFIEGLGELGQKLEFYDLSVIGL